MTRTRGWSRGLMAAALAALGASIACGDNGGVTAVNPVAAVTVTPATNMLYPAQSVQLAATIQDASGNALNREVAWESERPGVATVDARGHVTAIGAGATAVMATVDGITGAAMVTVLAPVADLTLTPPTATLLIAESVQLRATLRDATGAELFRPVSWGSDDPAVATVDPRGLVTALAPGVAEISATSEGQTTAATVTVQAPIAAVSVEPVASLTYVGQTLRLTAAVRDADGNPLNRPVSWASRRPGVATVDVNGLVTALAPGTATITASGAGVVGAANVTVLSPIASIEVSVSSLSIEAADSMQLTAVAMDETGALVVRPLTWTSDAPDIATVSTTGVVLGVSPGVAHVSVTGEGVTEVFEIVVLARTASVRISPTVVSPFVGEVVTLVAAALDEDSVVLNDRPATWTSSHPTVASVDQNGRVTAVGAGTATITATIGRASSSVVVTVIEGVAQVSLSAPVTTLDVTATTQLTALPIDRNGRFVNQPVQWTTSDASVATVSQSGLVTGVSPGSAMIYASAGGQRSSVAITVQPAVDRVVVTADKTMLTSDDPTAQVTAVVYSPSGTPMQVSVTWSSSDPAVLTVASTGPLTADVTFVGSGSATITATSQGKSGSVSITGNGPPSGTTETANNLSWPAIFTDGVTLDGAPVGTDAGLRPTVDEGITADTLPFWYHLNHPDWLNTWYLQGGTNTWRAEWLDGSANGPYSADVAWGDNLTHHSYDTHANVHIEVALYDRVSPALRGFNMFVLAGSGPTEVQGADGTVGLFSPMLYTSQARLLVQKLDTAGGTPLFTIVDEAVGAGFGGEVNKGGKVVYGYNLMIKNVTVPSGAAKYGWYRLSFIVDHNAGAGGVSLDGLAVSDDSEAPLYLPQLATDGTTSYLDIYISSASGGHG